MMQTSTRRVYGGLAAVVSRRGMMTSPTGLNRLQEDKPKPVPLYHNLNSERMEDIRRLRKLRAPAYAVLMKGKQPKSTKEFAKLLHAFAMTGDLEGAEAVLHKMNNDGFEPDTLTYNCLLKGYMFADKPRKAWGVLIRMKEAGVQRDKKTELLRKELIACWPKTAKSNIEREREEERLKEEQRAKEAAAVAEAFQQAREQAREKRRQKKLLKKQKDENLQTNEKMQEDFVPVEASNQETEVEKPERKQKKIIESEDDLEVQEQVDIGKPKKLRKKTVAKESENTSNMNAAEDSEQPKRKSSKRISQTENTDDDQSFDGSKTETSVKKRRKQLS
eukprot:TRINITY_DN79403_c0_g1_i1.p1 TRINITY_DN79403_c0_g1~~TRINITY_DN79403_c0_g1_i1.p1  ORF type:complete len:333 (-),score=112.20 TRINITY_DN79403_c0_g1_i1:897-1895(-)